MKSAEECAEWFVKKDAEDYYLYSLHESIRMIQRDALEAAAKKIEDGEGLWGDCQCGHDNACKIRAMKPEGIDD